MKPRLVKLLAVVAVIALLGGCAMLQTGKNLLCNPTEVQVQQAALAVAFIDMALTWVKEENLKIKLYIAREIFLKVKPGLCVVIDDLTQALKTVAETDGALQAQAPLKTMKGVGIVPKAPDLSALKAWTAK